jgi:hypothetical protein
MIKEKYEWVKEKLTQHPELRDSNERLYYHYLKEIGYDMNKSFKDALKDMEKRIIPYLDSFGRASRKVQEEHPHLRGKSYGKRKGEKQDKIRQEIRDLT